MKAEELNTMVQKMREDKAVIDTRLCLENYVYRLERGLRKIHRTELADQLVELVDEIDKVDTSELAILRTFQQKGQLAYYETTSILQR